MAIAREKYDFMLDFAERNNVILSLNGSCGFGRDCVGILTKDETYPDYDEPEYTWDDTPLDDNAVFVPDDAYHKHPCVAVLGHGEHAEEHLYEWRKWFDDNGYRVQCVELGNPPADLDDVSKFFWQHRSYKMVKNNA